MNTKTSSTLEDSAEKESLPFHKIFESQPGLVLILSPDLRIQSATKAYLREILTDLEEIRGKVIFDVFPDNPDAVEASTLSLKASFDQVLRTRKPHKMDKFRYDIPDTRKPGAFLERYWITINTPVLDDEGNVSCIIHETVNVTESYKSNLELKESQEREQVAKAQAEQQRIRLERLFEQAPAAFAMLEGPDLVYKVLNSAYQQLFPGRQLMGLPLFEALEELKGQPVEDIISNVYNTGETFEGKEVLIPVARYEGQAPEDIYWNFIYQALYDAQGKVNGILIFALDVTDFVVTRRQAEENVKVKEALNQELEERVERRTNQLKLAQAESEKQKLRFERLFMDAPAAICILDGPDLVFELVNPKYQKLFPGRTLQGKTLLEAMPEVLGTSVLQSLKKVYQTGITHEEQEMFIPFVRPKDGVVENRYFRYIQQARHNERGVIDGIMVLALEVTEQIEARNAVEASARQLKLITDALPVLISYVDKDCVYRFVNKAYGEWFPQRTESPLGQKVEKVLGEKAYAAVKNHIERALAGEKLEFEGLMPYRDGAHRYTHTSFIPHLQEGIVNGFYALVTDITYQMETRLVLEKGEQEAKMMAAELATTNEELRIANQQLLHTNLDLDNFIYTASHDLKAPISNIEMLMEELLIDLPAESLEQQDVRKIIDMIRGAIDRFKKTIANLTELSKLQKENLNEAKLVNLEEVVHSVMLDMEQTIHKSNAQISIEMQDCVLVSFSEKNLRSIIYNLLSNAIKYCHPERPPQVQIRCLKEGEELVLTVQDNGLGLNTEQQTKLFSMFRRFHDHVEGSGIGLYMVKRILDNTGGRIEVESRQGQGTLFKVYFKNVVDRAEVQVS